MNEKAAATLSPREIALYKGTRKSLLDLGNDVETKELVKAVLNVEDEDTSFQLDDGTLVHPSLKQKLVVNAVVGEVELAKRKGMKSIIDTQEALGETERKSADINLSLVDQDLKKRALGEK